MHVRHLHGLTLPSQQDLGCPQEAREVLVRMHAALRAPHYFFAFCDLAHTIFNAPLWTGVLLPVPQRDSGIEPHPHIDHHVQRGGGVSSEPMQSHMSVRVLGHLQSSMTSACACTVDIYDCD